MPLLVVVNKRPKFDEHQAVAARQRKTRNPQKMRERHPMKRRLGNCLN